MFLALSVSDAAEDVIAVIRAGARGYVTKTISASELADAIDRVLREPQRRRREQFPTRGLEWTEEALSELEEIPAFLRGRARRLAEERAHALDSSEVTPEILEESRS